MQIREKNNRDVCGKDVKISNILEFYQRKQERGQRIKKYLNKHLILFL